MWVAFKTHFDIGYTDTIEGVLRKYRVKMMDSALGIIDQGRQLPPEKRFAWIIPGWPAVHILGPKQEPARKPRIEQAVREGALAIQALPFSLHTESSDLEDLVRGMRFSSAIARKYGRPLPIAAKMTDVPCHSWVWPTVLAPFRSEVPADRQQWRQRPFAPSASILVGRPGWLPHPL